MTITQSKQAKSLFTYETAIEVQDLLVRRGVLAERAHDVERGRFIGDQAELVCSCGRHMLLDAVTSERDWARHVASALGISFGLAA